MRFWLASALWRMLAAGGPPTAAVDVQIAVDGAPCGASLIERVRARVGERASDGPGATTRVDAVLQQRPDGQWQLDLVITDGAGVATERAFEAPQCDTVLDAAAFTIAVALQPPADEPPARVPEPTPVDPAAAAPSGASAPAPVPAKAVVRAPTPPPPTRARKPSGFVRAGGGLDFGALPGAAGVFEAATGALGRSWRAEVLGSYRMQSIARARRDDAVGARFSSWAVGVRGCGVGRVRAFEFPVCVGADAGRVVADGFGFVGARRARRPWAALALAPGFAWAVHPRAALTTRVELGVPLVRTRFEVENLETLYRVRAAYGRVWIGVEGRFP